MKQPTRPSPGYTFVDASGRDHAPGPATGSKVKIRLEDHSVAVPFTGTLVDYILDLDFPGRGWYVVDLDTAIPIYSGPVAVILIQSRGGAGDDFLGDIPTHDPQGKKIIYYYKNPLEEMLTNPKSSLKEVTINVAEIRDRVILAEKRSSRSQLWVHSFATAQKAST